MDVGHLWSSLGECFEFDDETFLLLVLLNSCHGFHTAPPNSAPSYSESGENRHDFFSACPVPPRKFRTSPLFGNVLVPRTKCLSFVTSSHLRPSVLFDKASRTARHPTCILFLNSSIFNFCAKSPPPYGKHAFPQVGPTSSLFPFWYRKKCRLEPGRRDPFSLHFPSTWTITLPLFSPDFFSL